MAGEKARLVIPASLVGFAVGAFGMAMTFGGDRTRIQVLEQNAFKAQAQIDVLREAVADIRADIRVMRVIIEKNDPSRKP